MIRKQEATGKTVDEARAKACALLGVQADDLNVSCEVLEMPQKTGFLGLKLTPAKVCVSVEEPEVPIVIEENAKIKAAVDYLREVIALMGVENVTFSAVQKGEATIIRLDGEKLGALIGRRGETMESLSYLASLVANRLEGDYIKLGLDVAGYRDKRESDLTALVPRCARPAAALPWNP